MAISRRTPLAGLRIESRLLDAVLLWSYAAAKTRTVSLDLDEVDKAGASLLVRTEAGGGQTASPQQEAVVPTSMRRFLSELGVLVSVRCLIQKKGALLILCSTQSQPLMDNLLFDRSSLDRCLPLIWPITHQHLRPPRR